MLKITRNLQFQPLSVTEKEVALLCSPELHQPNNRSSPSYQADDG